MQFLCEDDGFSIETASQDVRPIPVGYVKPWRICVATTVEAKGRELNAVRKLARWIRDYRLAHFVDRSGREQAARTLMYAAVNLAGVQAR